MNGRTPIIDTEIWCIQLVDETDLIAAGWRLDKVYDVRTGVMKEYHLGDNRLCYIRQPGDSDNVYEMQILLYDTAAKEGLDGILSWDM